MTKQETYDYLRAHGVDFEITEHPAVFNMEECAAVDMPYPEDDAKNLLVRDDKKRSYYLITVRCSKRVDLKEFQRRHGTQIDSTMDLSLQQSILIDEQEELDSLKGRGALIGDPTVEFLETANPTSNLMNGDFVWDISATPTPPFKSGTARVSYTDEGFTAYFGGGE